MMIFGDAKWNGKKFPFHAPLRSPPALSTKPPRIVLELCKYIVEGLSETAKPLGDRPLHAP